MASFAPKKRGKGMSQWGNHHSGCTEYMTKCGVDAGLGKYQEHLAALERYMLTLALVGNFVSH